MREQLPLTEQYFYSQKDINDLAVLIQKHFTEIQTGSLGITFDTILTQGNEFEEPASLAGMYEILNTYIQHDGQSGVEDMEKLVEHAIVREYIRRIRKVIKRNLHVICWESLFQNEIKYDYRLSSAIASALEDDLFIFTMWQKFNNSVYSSIFKDFDPEEYKYEVQTRIFRYDNIQVDMIRFGKDASDYRVQVGDNVKVLTVKTEPRLTSSSDNSLDRIGYTDLVAINFALQSTRVNTLNEFIDHNLSS